MSKKSMKECIERAKKAGIDCGCCPLPQCPHSKRLKTINRPSKEVVMSALKKIDNCFLLAAMNGGYNSPQADIIHLHKWIMQEFDAGDYKNVQI